jgi:hypothetical protein
MIAKYTVSMLSFLLVACDNPGGVSDKFYAEFSELGSPKILYSCTRKKYSINNDLVQDCIKNGTSGRQDECMRALRPTSNDDVEVGYTAGVGAFSTYNKILGDAKAKCDGTFKILEGKS